MHTKEHVHILLAQRALLGATDASLLPVRSEFKCRRTISSIDMRLMLELPLLRLWLARLDSKGDCSGWSEISLCSANAIW